MSGRNVSIGRDAIKNIIQTGDHSTAQSPPPESVDIQAELRALQRLLGNLTTDDRQKIANALNEAVGDAAKPTPNRDEVGKGLRRALEYAREAADFGAEAATIATHVQNAVAWLGDNWNNLLTLVGLSK